MWSSSKCSVFLLIIVHQLELDIPCFWKPLFVVAFPRFSFVISFFSLPFVHTKQRDTSMGLIESPYDPGMPGVCSSTAFNWRELQFHFPCWVLLLGLEKAPLYICTYTYRNFLAGREFLFGLPPL